MAAVEVTISGVLYDKLARTTRPCVLIGEASLTGLEVGGGPMPGGPGGGSGAHPEHPIFWPPGTQPHPEHPIVLPPPGSNVPPPGSAPVIVPGTQPVNPMVPPPAVMIEYPGIGKVMVPQPTETAGGA